MPHQGTMEHGNSSKIQGEWMKIIRVGARLDPKGRLCSAIVREWHPKIDFPILSKNYTQKMKRTSASKYSKKHDLMIFDALIH